MKILIKEGNIKQLFKKILKRLLRERNQILVCIESDMGEINIIKEMLKR